MNIFGVGTWEILLILIIALIVAGPKRMLQWAYLLGRVVAQLRVMWGQAMDAVQSELDQAGVDVKVPKDMSRQELGRSLGEFAKPWTEEVKRVEQEYRDSISAVESEIKSVGDETKKEVKELDSSVKSATRTNPKPRDNAITRADHRSTARDSTDSNSTNGTSTGGAFGNWSSETAAERAATPDSRTQRQDGGFGTWSGRDTKTDDSTNDGSFGSWSSASTPDDTPQQDED